jgi:endonuclease/exonuclease/phosphatase family metal-dependent hydrolase
MRGDGHVRTGAWRAVRRRRVLAAVLACAQALGCVRYEPDERAAPASKRSAAAERHDAASDVRARGAGSAGGGAAATSLQVMTWNLDWFGDAGEGPSDDAAQYAAVRDILRAAAADVIALQEVASPIAFARLVSELPGRAGVLSAYDWTQKTALVWNAARFELVSQSALAGLPDAGRPPLEVTLRRTPSGEALLVVVIHAKAQADAASHATRARFAEGLKAHLDAEHADVPLCVLGDFNDALIGSITRGADTPYRAFVDDARRYALPTRALDAPGAAESSYAWGPTIDHVVVSDELAPGVDAAGAEVLRDELLAGYPDFTARVTDHFPVVLRLWR